MPIQGEINQNQNVVGLFTEGSPLNFPEGATVRDENFVLDTDGSRRRRLGMGIENNAVQNPAYLSDDSTFVFDWDAVGNNGNLNFAVICNNGRVSFYDKSYEPLSDGYIVTVSEFFTGGVKQVQAASVNGNLVLVGSERGEVVVFSYDENFKSIRIKGDVIKVRDIWGVDDPLRVDQRPKSLTSAHAYNLANQGWNYANARLVRDVGVAKDTVTDPDTGDTEVVVTDGGAWPSNADLVTYGISEADENDRFKEKLYRTVPFGTTPAPKGSCIVRLTNMAQDRYNFAVQRGYGAFASEGTYTDYVYNGPKTVASYAGRVFYAGFTDSGYQENSTYPNLTSTLVFSRSVQNKEDIVKCYQEADPATLDSEIVASDGGTIQIAGSGFIYKLVPIGRSLLIMASEGIWELYSTDQLFSATNYQVRKITDIGCKSTNSVIVAENTPMYWTDYGIYALVPDQVSESFVAQNITMDTIQTYFNEVPPESVRKVFGMYDQFDKKARWLWSTDTGARGFNRELIFDIRLQSWYTNLYPDLADLELRGMVQLNSFSEIEVTSNIVAGEDNVVAGTDQVVVLDRAAQGERRSYKYIVTEKSGNTQYYFYEFNNGSYLDFGQADAEAVMVTGPFTGGDSIRRKNSSYLTVQLRKTEDGFQYLNGVLTPINQSACIVESRWDWTDLAVAGKFNSPVEMYRHRRHYIPAGVGDGFDNGETVVTTKSRLRGSGRSIALKISSSPGKDLNLLGYNIQLTSNQKV